MAIIITVIILIAIFTSSYLLGNSSLETFDKEPKEQFISSLFGLLICLGIFVLGVIILLIYSGVNSLLK